MELEQQGQEILEFMIVNDRSLKKQEIFTKEYLYLQYK